MRKLIPTRWFLLALALNTAVNVQSCPVYYYYNSIGLGAGANFFNGGFGKNIQLSREGQIFWKGEGRYRNHVNYNLSFSSSIAAQDPIRSVKFGLTSDELYGGCGFGAFLSPGIQYAQIKQEGRMNNLLGPSMEINLRPYSKGYTFFKLSMEYTRLFELRQSLRGGNFFSVNLSLCLSTVHYKFGHYKLRKGNRSSGGFNF